MNYSVYHPADGSCNHNLSEKIEFALIISLNAEHKEEVWTKCQNDFNKAYAKLKKRSMAVGDVIKDADGYHMVLGEGFKSIKPITVTDE